MDFRYIKKALPEVSNDNTLSDSLQIGGGAIKLGEGIVSGNPLDIIQGGMSAISGVTDLVSGNSKRRGEIINRRNTEAWNKLVDRNNLNTNTENFNNTGIVAEEGIDTKGIQDGEIPIRIEGGEIVARRMKNGNFYIVLDASKNTNKKHGSKDGDIEIMARVGDVVFPSTQREEVLKAFKNNDQYYLNAIVEKLPKAEKQEFATGGQIDPPDEFYDPKEFSIPIKYIKEPSYSKTKGTKDSGYEPSMINTLKAFEGYHKVQDQVPEDVAPQYSLRDSVEITGKLNRDPKSVLAAQRKLALIDEQQNYGGFPEPLAPENQVHLYIGNMKNAPILPKSYKEALPQYEEGGEVMPEEEENRFYIPMKKGGKVDYELLDKAYMAKSGIYIKPKNRGKFTASAKKAGEGVQEHAKHVLANPNATPLQKKRANFARNAAEWHHAKDGLDTLQEGAEDLLALSPTIFNLEQSQRQAPHLDTFQYQPEQFQYQFQSQPILNQIESQYSTDRNTSRDLSGGNISNFRVNSQVAANKKLTGVGSVYNTEANRRQDVLNQNVQLRNQANLYNLQNQQSIQAQNLQLAQVPNKYKAAGLEGLSDYFQSKKLMGNQKEESERQYNYLTNRDNLLLGNYERAYGNRTGAYKSKSPLDYLDYSKLF